MRPFRAPLRSLLPAILLAAPALAAPGCVASSSEAHGIALDDPLGLVMDVARAGNPLRVYVLPASSYACNDTVGTITPDIPDLAAGMVPDAVVDIEAAISGDMASAMATIPTGDWTVLVRGKGTDPVSGRPNRIIATGCATVSGLAASETRAVNITLLPQHDSGMCNDHVLSPDEQCEAPTPDCDATCHTTPINVNVAVVMGAQTNARTASASGQRITITYDSAGADIGLRLLDANGGTITSPAQLMQDDTSPSMMLPGVQLHGSPAMAADGHFAIAVEDYRLDTGDIQIEFFTLDHAPNGTAAARTSTTGTQLAPSAAYAGNGTLLVAFEDSQSTTGIAGRIVPAGSTTPMGSEAFDVGTGSAAATHPAVAGLPTGFVIAFTTAGDIRFQRFAANGAPMDSTSVSVLDAADATDTQDQPAIAANADGSFLVAWTEHSVANGDGSGTSIRARAFTAAGMPAGPAIVLPSTDASKAGDQNLPTVAAADGRYVVAWASGGGVHARFVSGMGVALPNREQPQSTNDFVVAATGNAPSAVAMGTTIASWLIAYDNGDQVFARRYPR